MEIGAERFKQIVAAARAQGSQRGGKEKRDAVRIGVRYTATVRPIIPGINVAATPFTASIRDISCKGVGLTCPVPLVARFSLEMPDVKGVVYVVNCVVIHSRTIDKEQFQIGAAFVE